MSSEPTVYVAEDDEASRELLRDLCESGRGDRKNADQNSRRPAAEGHVLEYFYDNPELTSLIQTQII